MRGGAYPFMIWAALLAAFAAANTVWTGDVIQMAELGTGVLITLIIPVGLVLRSREALRRGGPTGERGPRRVPTASTGAPLLALGFASLFYGFSFGHLFVYVGLGIIAGALGKLAVELYSQLHHPSERDQRSSEPDRG